MPDGGPPLTVERFGPELRADFFRLHDADGAGWCYCAAWWVETWAGWGERTREQNRALRLDLCRRGEWDGYLLYEAQDPVGWCQVGPRDRLAKLVREFGLEPDPAAWAVTCFEVRADRRRRGHARRLLEAVLRDLPARGARRVEAFPRRGSETPGELWNGPEALFAEAGFRVAREHPRRPVLVLELGAG